MTKFLVGFMDCLIILFFRYGFLFQSSDRLQLQFGQIGGYQEDRQAVESPRSMINSDFFFSQRNEYTKRFLPRELKLVEGLNHPNVVKVFEVCLWN